MVSICRAACAAATIGLLLTTAAIAQTNGPGVTDKEIKIGQTMPYSGPVSAWSVQGRVDLAYMKRLNANGGINGRTVKLLSLDDGFSPPKAVERVRELTGGYGVHSVLECVGLEQAMNTAISIARPGGAVGRVGVPQEQTIPGSEPAFYNNVMVGGGVAPVRAYIEDLLPDVLEGNIEPGRVFDRTVGLDGVPDGYRAMNDREAIKVMVTP